MATHQQPDHGHVQIRTHGARTACIIDGVDISSGLRGLTLRIAGDGQLPTLELDPLILAADITLDGGPLGVLIPPRTRDALIALGWRPPPAAG